MHGTNHPVDWNVYNLQKAACVNHVGPGPFLVNTQNANTLSLDLLVADRSHNLSTNIGYTWQDPIVVNETAGWLASISDVQTQSGEVCERTDGASMSLATNLKKPRGRPKKKASSKTNQSSVNLGHHLHKWLA